MKMKEPPEKEEGWKRTTRKSNRLVNQTNIPEREAGQGLEVGRVQEDVADPPEREVGENKSGGWKLAKLRARMATEKERIIKFLDERKQLERDEVLMDITRLWKGETEIEKIPEIDRSIPTGWIG